MTLQSVISWRNTLPLNEAVPSLTPFRAPTAVSLKALAPRTPITWRKEDLAAPKLPESRYSMNFPLATLRGLFDCTPFFPMGLKRLLTHAASRATRDTANSLFAEGNGLLDRIVDKNTIKPRVCFLRNLSRRRGGDDFEL